MVFPRAFQSYVPRSHCISSHVYGVILISPDRETVVIRGRQTGKWSFPKGHGTSDELPYDAAIRELKEETGLEIKAKQADDELRFKSGTYYIFYVDEKLDLRTEDTKEVMDCMWTPLSRLPYLVGNMDLTTFCKKISRYAST